MSDQDPAFYLVDQFDPLHIQFCPVRITITEISLRTAFGEICRHHYQDVFFDADFRTELSEGDFTRPIFEKLAGKGIADLLGYKQTDTVLLIRKSTDSHLGTASLGFRIFKISFEELPVPGATIRIAGTDEEETHPFARE